MERTSSAWYALTTPYIVDLSRQERGYPKEVGPREADDLRVSLLDLYRIYLRLYPIAGAQGSSWW